MACVPMSTSISLPIGCTFFMDTNTGPSWLGAIRGRGFLVDQKEGTFPTCVGPLSRKGKEQDRDGTIGVGAALQPSSCCATLMGNPRIWEHSRHGDGMQYHHEYTIMQGQGSPEGRIQPWKESQAPFGFWPRGGCNTLVRKLPHCPDTGHWMPYKCRGCPI